MLKISQAIIVEGKYDKIKLSGIVDTLIIEINGFQIYKDKEKTELIRYLAKTSGIVIMTDSDHAGIQLRNKLNDLAVNGTVFNAYVPEILGKEKRKTQASKSGLLGVEGIDKELIISALKNCGIFDNVERNADPQITDAFLYNLGLTGRADSKQLRTRLLKSLGLPGSLSKNNLLKILQMQYNTTQLESTIEKLRRNP